MLDSICGPGHRDDPDMVRKVLAHYQVSRRKAEQIVRSGVRAEVFCALGELATSNGIVDQAGFLVSRIEELTPDNNGNGKHACT